ncbi:MAG TPA: ATP-grasp domain-containing protein [Candidatus Polarisedimenticolaceae bacterium]|nr:ATP-grasp domain-containing protein [Candidatus Polarisedimenticolaceae bacterium]
MNGKKKNNKERLRILVLFEILEQPAPDEEYERRMREEADWRTEGHVCAALKARGHEVHLGAIYKNARDVIDLVERIQPDLVWNFVQTFHGTRYFESHVAGMLELCRVPYTGCGHRALMLCQDKGLSKEILKHHRVAVPPFVVSRLSQPQKRLSKSIFPVMVKPLAEEGSVGISRDSFAETEEQALARASFLHERLKQDVIVEHYVSGREIYVGVIGNDRLKVLPPRELKFSKVPEGEPKFASFKAKWDEGYRERWGIFSTFPEDLSEGMTRSIATVAKRVFRALQMRGFGRIDLRLTEEGKLVVVEANPNPEIARGEDLAEAAAKVGVPYEDLIEKIAYLGLEQSRPTG